MTSRHRVLEHRARAVGALLALALAACVLGACGGGGGGSGDAQTLLKQTFTGKHKIDSGKANLQLAIDAQGGSSALRGPIKLGVTGPFQSAGSAKLPKFDLALNIAAQGQTFQAGLTSTTDKLFVDFGGTAYEVPGNLVTQIEQSMKKSQQQGASSTGKLNIAGLGLDPESWLSDATVTGKETVGGVETDHITAKLNVDALLNDVDKLLAQVAKQGLGAATPTKIPSKIPDGTRKQIEDAVKSATVDVWTGVDDKTLRKLAIALKVEPTSGSVKSASVAFSIELSDLNKPQTVTPPSNTRPLSELLGQFQGLLGGSVPGLDGGSDGSSGSSGGSGSSGSGGAGSAQIQKYTQCLKDAAGDVTKAQACAALLTK